MKNIKVSRKFKFLPNKNELPFLVLLLPALVTVILFAYLPMFGMLIAFKDYKAKLGIFGSPWADLNGFSNFVQIFNTPGLPEAIVNTLVWNILGLLLSFPLPIVLALLFDEVHNMGFKRVTQTISYLPHFLSWISVAGIAISLLGQYGLINDIIKALTGERIIFLGDSKYFLPVYLFIIVWKNMGWDSILYISAMSSIDPTLYEAVKIDGASRVGQVWHITLPGILPTAMIMLIMKIGGLFSSNFDLVYALQNAAWNTDVISTAVYNFGIGQGQYSLATALSLLQGVVALIITLTANKISKVTSNVSMW